MLIPEVLIVEIPEETKGAMMPPGMGGAMGGMY
jgi:hypothetical protein